MTLYTSTARFDDHQRELSRDELREIAPSIFAKQAFPDRSEKFRPIATIDVLDALKKDGFVPVAAKQRPVRNAQRKAYTKHLLRLRSLEDGRKYEVGDSVFEILLANANDGSSAYDIMGGLFRIRCLNSLVSADSTLHSMRVKHTGDVIPKVSASMREVLAQAAKVLAAPDKWSKVVLTAVERKALAEVALKLRFPHIEKLEDMPIQLDAILATRREDDNGNDLWRTYNVIQENIIRGGVQGVTRMTEGATRRMTTREVKAIDKEVNMNKQLWQAAADMAS